MPKWRPIETAPKDIVAHDHTGIGKLVHHYGEYFLAWPVNGEVKIVRWWNTTGSSTGESGGFVSEGGPVHHPTHWLPLPEPPNEEEEW